MVQFDVENVDERCSVNEFHVGTCDELVVDTKIWSCFGIVLSKDHPVYTSERMDREFDWIISQCVWQCCNIYVYGCQRRLDVILGRYYYMVTRYRKLEIWLGSLRKIDSTNHLLYIICIRRSVNGWRGLMICYCNKDAPGIRNCGWLVQFEAEIWKLNQRRTTTRIRALIDGRTACSRITLL